MDRGARMQRSLIICIVVLLNFFFVTTHSYAEFASKSVSKGKIRGYILLPKGIDITTAPNEATVYIYLKDYTPKEGKEVLPWEAPVKKVIDCQINSLRDHKVTFEFRDLPKGMYGVSVLIDTGRPHVPHGSLNFTAYPGDYTGGTKENIELEGDQTVEVSINEGLYVTIPDGYKAPLYSPE